MSPTRRNFMVGAVVLTALVVLAWMVLQFANTTADALFAGGMRIELRADSAGGVSEGSAVDYLRVNVGHVTDVKFTEDRRGVIIEAQIDEGHQIPKNVVGVIRRISQLGDTAAISLETEGTPSNEFLAEGAKLEAMTRDSGLIPPEVTALAREVREQKMIQQMTETIVSIRQQSEKVGRLADSVNKLVSDDKMLTDLRESMANLRTATKQADQIASDFKKFSGNLDKTTKSLNERIDQTGLMLTRFQTVADRLEKGEGTLGLLSKDPRLYESLVDTSKELNATITDLKRLVEQWEEEGVSLKLK